jgi:hypothetical protein
MVFALLSLVKKKYIVRGSKSPGTSWLPWTHGRYSPEMPRTIMVERIRDDLGNAIPGLEGLEGELPVYIALVELTPWNEKDRRRPRRYIIVSTSGEVLRNVSHDRSLMPGISHAVFVS